MFGLEQYELKIKCRCGNEQTLELDLIDECQSSWWRSAISGFVRICPMVLLFAILEYQTRPTLGVALWIALTGGLIFNNVVARLTGSLGLVKLIYKNSDDGRNGSEAQAFKIP